MVSKRNYFIILVYNVDTGLFYSSDIKIISVYELHDDDPE